MSKKLSSSEACFKFERGDFAVASCLDGSAGNSFCGADEGSGEGFGTSASVILVSAEFSPPPFSSPNASKIPGFSGGGKVYDKKGIPNTRAQKSKASKTARRDFLRMFASSFSFKIMVGSETEYIKMVLTWFTKQVVLVYCKWELVIYIKGCQSSMTAVILKRYAKSITYTTCSFEAFGLGLILIVAFAPFLFFSALTALARSTLELDRPLRRNVPLALIVIVGGVEFTFTELFFPGSFKFKAFGTTIELVNMKNIKSRNMISVKDDILNSALTLLFFLSPIYCYF